MGTYWITMRINRQVTHTEFIPTSLLGKTGKDESETEESAHNVSIGGLVK